MDIIIINFNFNFNFNFRNIGNDLNVFKGLVQNPIFVGILLFTVAAQYGLVEFGGAFVRTVRSLVVWRMCLFCFVLPRLVWVFEYLIKALILSDLIWFHLIWFDSISFHFYCVASSVKLFHLSSLPSSLSPLRPYLKVHLNQDHWVKCVLLGAVSLPIGGLMRFIPCEDSEDDYASVNPLIKMKAAVKRYGRHGSFLLQVWIREFIVAKFSLCCSTM